MPTPGLTRRTALLVPLLIAACARRAPENFPALRYSYLPPIRLSVATIEIQQRFFPSGIAPDVSQLAPVRPVDALRAMAEDRLQAFGGAGRAVFAILDASLARRGNVINGALAARLDVYGPDNRPDGFAEARVTRQHTGDIDSLPATLYEMVRAMMDSMNVEFEYQVRRALRASLSTGTAGETPVEQTPLAAPGTTDPSLTGAPAPVAPPAPEELAPDSAPTPGLLPLSR